MTEKFRVRFCPSPSSNKGIHLGNLKTALFNFLFAKKYGADWLFRIEDTDQERAVPGCADNILNELRWVSMTPTMGYGTDNKPAKAYTQMERLDIYQHYANKLVDEGKAYRCYCDEKQLDKLRKEAEEKNPKNPWKYPGTCRNIKEKLDKPFAIRFKAPISGFTEYEDVVFGKRKFPNSELYDFVIIRANGTSCYNFAVVVDDGITDQISHVIRGSDHLKNMPMQIQLYEALGVKPPIFLHLSMLRNKDNKKLSKRDGSVSVDEYRDKGYAPGAILNYLVKFGWGHGDKEIFSMQEMIDLFTLEACHSRDGKFDPVKFAAINYEHLKSKELTSDLEYAKLLKPFIDARNIGNIEADDLCRLVPIVRGRARTFVEAAELLAPMLQSEADAPEDLVKKTFTEQNTQHLKNLGSILKNVDMWDENNLRTKVQDWLKSQNLSLKDVGAPLRVSLLGTSVSPELFQVMGALGKETSLRRLDRTLNKISVN